jgi:nitroimidazol reductase NimA-like FMN-containing flavoprotein (pyridoxamine 5'-phosphate oxidase superfamily)
MLGKLDNSKIEALLKSQVIGRIGCCDDGVCYIVPVNYVYDGKYIFAHSAKGMKLEMLRNNPDLCFEVDHITDIVNWESVIAWGVFEEITTWMNNRKRCNNSLTESAPSLLPKQHIPRMASPRTTAISAMRLNLLFIRSILPKKPAGSKDNKRYHSLPIIFGMATQLPA